MTVSQVYRKYRLLPGMQKHMLEVSAVGAFLCDHIQEVIDNDSIIKALTLHDVGKIVTIKLGLIPGTWGKKPLEYWREIQEDFRKKYGVGKEATLNICREIGLSDRLIELVEATRFSNADEAYKSGDMEKMICVYADQRVSPFGIAGLEYRMEEGRVHYRLNKKVCDEAKDERQFNYYAEHLYKIQDRIFENIDLTPEDITDEAVFKYIPKIKKMNLN
ncbi:MAG: hypothetical protein ABIE03_02870 [Patescibacteria group bacterium]|nr:hypothetical protein [Patescibacteria group bacterium]